MSAPKTNDPFFPSIRDAAEQTDNLEDRPDNESGIADPNAAEEERPLQEIESLCMSCGEQVGILKPTVLLWDC